MMNTSSTILITGGTGLIGRALSKMLVEKGYEVIILTRAKPVTEINVNEKSETGIISYAEWNIEKQTIDEAAIRKADHVIHLAGANVGDKRWTRKRKKEIVESRTKSSALLVKAIKEIPNNIKTVVSASGIGWYGEDSGGGPFQESDLHAEGFLGQTCLAWEQSISPVKELRRRLVILRMGIVLSNAGGALAEFKKPLKFGIATILGNGKQKISWMHIDDACRLFCFAIENQQMHGVYNGVTPQTESNKTLITELAKKIRGNFFIPIYVPAFLLKLFLGEMSIEILKSTTVSNQKIRQAGFRCVFPSLDSALKDLSNSSKV